ncbi:hypothetical protein [Pseudanabaena sp. FACHB-2040]|uniref:hypothetical protein n=1 Tax=Pseudanabaena sp. FACHB-2040 TaxID=2692859 RepID=UPI001684A545|nr:hypothetical protein [Pseudanabaena sp. FACHB-2040]MBD2256059.1 hypothetical protein [Pseudanabaena sp. FACHB-2040]
MESKPHTFKETVKETSLLFSGGAGAGLIAFALFSGIWQVDHFRWVMGGTTLACGVLAVLLRQNFVRMLSALMNNAPWL